MEKFAQISQLWIRSGLPVRILQDFKVPGLGCRELGILHEKECQPISQLIIDLINVDFTKLEILNPDERF